MKHGQEISGLAKAFRSAGPYINITYTLIASLAMFGLAGWWLDDRMKTNPLFFIVGLFVGLGIGFYSFFKSITKLENRDKKTE